MRARDNVRRLVRDLWRGSRAAEWGFHLLTYALAGGLYAVAAEPVPAGFWRWFLDLMVFQLFYYPAAYLFNNLCDAEADTLRTGYGLPPRTTPGRWLLLSLCLPGYAWAWALFPAGALIVCVVLACIAVAYSAEPLRLKTRGVAGVLAAALAQRIPFFLLLVTRSAPVIAPAAVISAYLVTTGILHILYHQLEDLELDRRTHTETWAVTRGSGFVRKLCLYAEAFLAASAVVSWVIPLPPGLREHGREQFAAGYTFLAGLTLGLLRARYGRALQSGKLRVSGP